VPYLEIRECTSFEKCLRCQKLTKLARAKARDWLAAFAKGSKLHYARGIHEQALLTNDLLMSIWLQGNQNHPNPLLKCGKRYFSQSDEDGIILEILRRINLSSGVCVEVGCGNGTENNTLNLLLRGWRSVWIDAGPLALDSKCNPDLLSFQQAFATTENVVMVTRRGLSDLRATHVDLLSIGVDGNDGYLADALLASGLQPSVVIIEVNEVIPPPICFAQKYDPDHVWNRTKNSGWSLQALADKLVRYGYSCVGCNLHTGVNAFFVRDTLLQHFSDVPRDLATLYVGRSLPPFKYRDRRTQVTADLVEALIRSAGVTRRTEKT